MKFLTRTIEDLRGARITMPGEFDAAKPVIVVMSLPAAHTDWDYILRDAQEQYASILEMFSHHSQPVLLLTPESPVKYNDTWTRDYCPLQVQVDFPVDHPDNPGVSEMVLLHFGFNGWGLKFAANHDNLVGTNVWKCVECTEYVLEGGSVESNGKGIILTTEECLCSPNRNGGLNREQAQARLRKYLGADRVVWIKGVELAGDDTDGHIDTMARFTDANTVVYSHCTDKTHRDYASLKSLQEQLHQQFDEKVFRLIPIPHPNEMNDPEGEPMPGTYANFLITPTVVYVPTYHQPHHDAEALRILRTLFPKREVVGIDCRILLRQHGSLHCATMQMHQDVCRRYSLI